MKKITKIIASLFRKEIVTIEKKEETRIEERKGPLYAYRTKR
jgi:hypothetical protein